jgi:hypothetical protein
MIVVMKSITAYLLTVVLLVALGLNGVDGMILCFCADGRVAVEVACGDSERCCDEEPTAARNANASDAHECGSCTDVALAGLDAPSLASRGSSKFVPVDCGTIHVAAATVAIQAERNDTPAYLVAATRSAISGRTAVLRI